MLQACFGLGINELSQICTIPQLIEGYLPNLDELPQFILGLARDVDWDTEQECFEGVAEVCFLFPMGVPKRPSSILTVSESDGCQNIVRPV